MTINKLLILFLSIVLLIMIFQNNTNKEGLKIGKVNIGKAFKTIGNSIRDVFKKSDKAQTSAQTAAVVITSAQAEADRLANEAREIKDKKAEADRLAKEAQAEIDRLANEAREIKDKKAEADRLANEAREIKDKKAKAEAERLANEAKAEAERLANEAKAEAERLAKEKERLEAEQKKNPYITDIDYKLKQSFETVKTLYNNLSTYGTTIDDDTKNRMRIEVAQIYYDKSVKEQTLSSNEKKIAAKAYFDVAEQNNKYDPAKTIYNIEQNNNNAKEWYGVYENAYKNDIEKCLETSTALRTEAKNDTSKANEALKKQFDCFDISGSFDKYEYYKIADDYLKSINSTNQNGNDKKKVVKALYDYSSNYKKLDAAKQQYEIFNDIDSGYKYYEVSKNKVSYTNDEPEENKCKSKCLAANAYYNTVKRENNTDLYQGKLFGEASNDYNKYIKSMGEKCENVVSSCEGFSNKRYMEGFSLYSREGFKSCETNIQKSKLYETAKSAYDNYNTTSTYSEYDALTNYYNTANEPGSGTNSNDRIDIAYAVYDKSKKLDINTQLDAAKEYYNASIAMDCGSELNIKNKQYLAIKAYYDVLNSTNKSSAQDKYKISKEYYQKAINANRLDKEKYDIAKEYYKNSVSVNRDISDAARAVYETAFLPRSGASNLERFEAMSKYKDVNREIMKNSEFAIRLRDYALSTKQPNNVSLAYANNVVSIEGFTDFTDFLTNDCTQNKEGTKTTCVKNESGVDLLYNDNKNSRKIAYDTAKKPGNTINDLKRAAEAWSGVNYENDIVKKRLELDDKLSQLQNIETDKMSLDATIMANIAATVLASSLIVYSITKL